MEQEVNVTDSEHEHTIQTSQKYFPPTTNSYYNN